MRCVLLAALDLSTSTKPFDSVTAAHLLNLLLPQPDLSQALLHFARQQGLQFTPPRLPPQPSESAIVEVNALAGEIRRLLLVNSVNFSKRRPQKWLTLFSVSVIQFLLQALQLEVWRAESSLLQAAASYPLYGRAHCITAVLQNLNTE